MNTLIDKITIAVIVLTLLVFASDSFGQAKSKEISVLIYHVKADGGLTPSLTKSVVGSAINVINGQINTIKLKPTLLINKRNVFKRYLKPNGENALWIKWSRWLMKSYPHYKVRHTIIPAIPSNDGRWYSVGISSASCPFSEWTPKGGGSFSTAYQTRPNGKDGLLRSINIMAHELLHQLGAKHVEALPPTLMHSGLGLTWEETENANHIHRKTKREVNRCVSGQFDGGF